MKIYRVVREQIGFIFVFMLFSFAIVNSISQWPDIKSNILWTFKAKSISEIRSRISGLESAIGDSLLGKAKFIDGYAYLQLLMGKEEMDNFYALRDVNKALKLGGIYPFDVNIAEKEAIHECAKRLWRLQQNMAEGARLLFVNPPALYVRDKTMFNPGLPYKDLNHRQDAFLYWLQQYGVEYIDIRESLEKHRIPAEDYFFHTDHHWTIETAFLSFGDIIAELDKTQGPQLDPEDYFKDIRNYNSKTYKNAFLGAVGRKAGIVFSALDDFTVIWPQFETDFTYEGFFLNPQKKYSIRGPAEESLFVKEVLSTEKPYQTDLYSVYAGGIKGSERIVNHLYPEGPKLLMIHDSFSMPLGVFMAPMFSEIQMIWTASSEDKIDIASYLKENNFDYIIVEMYEDNLSADYFYYYNEPLENE